MLVMNSREGNGLILNLSQRRQRLEGARYSHGRGGEVAAQRWFGLCMRKINKQQKNKITFLQNVAAVQNVISLGAYNQRLGIDMAIPLLDVLYEFLNTLINIFLLINITPVFQLILLSLTLYTCNLLHNIFFLKMYYLRGYYIHFSSFDLLLASIIGTVAPYRTLHSFKKNQTVVHWHKLFLMRLLLYCCVFFFSFYALTACPLFVHF